MSTSESTANRADPVKGVRLLIDTNIYLDFYRSNKHSIQILSGLSEHFDKIILTDQIIQEFERNREIVLKGLKASFESESKLKYISSAYLDNLPEFSKLRKAQNYYDVCRTEVNEALNSIIESPEKDPIYSFFTDMVRECTKMNTILNTTDEIIQRAHKRKLIGNPPTSSGFSIGDEINWEIVCANLKENIILIGRDSTYTTNFSFLKRDFHRNTGCIITHLTDSITVALKEIGFAMSPGLEDLEQKMLDELKGYNEYWTSPNSLNDKKND
jgi:hypothetical protein